MRYFIVIPMILLGSFLIGLRVNDLGNIGNFLMNLVGFGFMGLEVLISRRKREKLVYK
ncbi:serine kinase [Pseudalkalibacillus sp. JSM 102089]|uniref:serine kinase n=1 Tax=Pseudalkalibacillus sp. JSM 102089 TaxID=3229856 RepID=UPI003526B520